ncbi:hypothetical protein BASA83_003116 [Batrachochytrium salamandrivorans]|nr:hypothetical protein BASA83_003116 [Batrachochytrium salamandrivorans]
MHQSLAARSHIALDRLAGSTAPSDSANRKQSERATTAIRKNQTAYIDTTPLLIPTLKNELSLFTSHSAAISTKGMFTSSQERIVASRSSPRLFVLDTRQFDINILIADAVAAVSLKINQELESILASTEFEHFLTSAVVFTRAFIREQLVRTQERASKSWTDVPPAFIRQVNEISKQEFFTTEGISVAEARASTATTLHDFSLAYCFILLYNSRQSHGLAKERYHFEGMYTVVIEVVKTALAIHSLDSVVDYELQRLFRSSVFAARPKQDLVDPIQIQFISALQNQHAHSKNDISTRLSTVTYLNMNTSWRRSPTVAPNQSRLTANRSRSSKISTNVVAATAGASAHHRMGGVGQWGNAVGSSRPIQQMLGTQPFYASSAPSTRCAPTTSIGQPKISDSASSNESATMLANQHTQSPEFYSTTSYASHIHQNANWGKLANTQTRRAPVTQARHKQLSLNAVRMLRSPLANETLPPVQRFLFVQSRPEAISSVVG